MQSEDPVSVFDFPMVPDRYCYMCNVLLDYHEQLGICYTCEMECDSNYTTESDSE